MIALDFIENVLSAISNTSFKMTSNVLSSDSILVSAAVLSVLGFTQPYLCGVFATRFFEQHESTITKITQGAYDEFMRKLDPAYLPHPTSY